MSWDKLWDWIEEMCGDQQWLLQLIAVVLFCIGFGAVLGGAALLGMIGAAPFIWIMDAIWGWG